MKKQLKKLALNRETLRQLEEKALRPAGAASFPCNTDSECVCSYTNCSGHCFHYPTCPGC